MSAVSSVRTLGVLVTVMPCLAAATTSILSVPLPKLAMSLRLGPAAWMISSAIWSVMVGTRTVGVADSLDQFRLGQPPVIDIKPRLEEFAHARLDGIRQFTGNDDQRLFAHQYSPPY